MINALNSIPMIQNVGMSKPASSPVSVNNNIVQNPNLNGANALGIYNQAAVSKPASKTITPILPTILQPEAIHSIEGSRIYNATGELDSIVKKGENFTTVYKMDIQAPNDAIRKIQTFDNKTGKLIKSQENLNIIENGQMPQIKVIELKEFNPDGKVKASSIFYEGKPEMIAEYEYGPNGYEKKSAIAQGRAIVEEEFPEQNISKMTRFDAKGQIASVETINRAENSSQTVFYKNGIPARLINESKSPIPNNTGKNPLADPDLIPSHPFILGYDPKQVQGNKVYYSNGEINAIETLTANNGRMVHRFEANGNLAAIEDSTNPANKKQIFFYDNYQAIEEDINGQIHKTTTHNDDGTKEVGVVNTSDNSEKYAMYSKDGKMKSYIDIDKDGNRMMMQFDKAGNLISVN